MKAYQADIAKFEASGAKVYGVSTDTLEINTKFHKELGLTFPLLSDTGRNVCLLYGTAEKLEEKAKFRSFLIDKNGVLRAAMGDFEKRLAEHAADCLKKLRELGLE